MPLMNLAPNSGVWDLRLGTHASRAGVYLLEVYDKTAMTQGGPFPLRFPNDQYALEWFDAFAIEDTRTPTDDREAVNDLVEGFIEAQGSSEIWGPICNALFHSDHQGPFLSSPWWYGSTPPFVGANPMDPVLQSSDQRWCQLFTDLDTAEVVGIRKQIGDESTDDDAVSFLWWVDDDFVPQMPIHLGEGRQFRIVSFDEYYLNDLVQLLEQGLPFPEIAEWLLGTPPQRELRINGINIGFVEMLGSLLNDVNVNFADLDIDPRIIDAAMWLGGKTATTAQGLVEIIVALQVLRARDAPIRKDSEPSVDSGQFTPSPDISSESQSHEYERDAFHEVLFGPGADSLFALHFVEAGLLKGEAHWQVENHWWRCGGDWDGDFPEYQDDWRWLAENERLARMPEVVARVQRERDQDEEFMLAWDVSDSIRIRDAYEHIITDLFDRPIDIPVGIGDWMAIDPQREVNMQGIVEMSPRAAECAQDILGRTLRFSTEDAPENGLRNLRTFIVNGRSMSASVVTRAMAELLVWMQEVNKREGPASDHLGPEGFVVPEPKMFTGTQRLVAFVAAMVALTDDTVVVNVDATDSHPEVYVQLCREDDGALTLEAISNEFLDRPLTPDQVATLHSLGWEDPREGGLPNFHQFIEQRATAPGAVAEILVRTLHQVYGTDPGDAHQFAPFELASNLLGGAFGREYAANPNMNPARRARLMWGIRFPNDLDPSPHSG